MKYRVVLPTLWSSRAFRSLPASAPSAQLLYVYLLTGPEATAVPGLVHAGLAALAEALRWALKDLEKHLAVLEDAGLVRADRDARVVVLPVEVASARPANPNVAKHWAQVLAESPDCDLRDEVARLLSGTCEPLGEPFAKPFREAFAKRFAQPSRNHDHDHDLDPKHEHEHEHEGARGETAAHAAPGADAPLAEESSFNGSAAKKPDPADELWSHYLAVRARVRPRMRKSALDPKDRKTIRERLKTFDLEALKLSVDGLFLSPHHLGTNDRATEYLGIEYALKTENVEGFVARAEGGRRATRRALITDRTFDPLPLRPVPARLAPRLDDSASPFDEAAAREAGDPFMPAAAGVRP